MSEYREPVSLVSCVVCHGICTFTRCTELHKEFAKTELSLPLIVGFGNSVTSPNYLVANNHDVFPVVDWQQVLLMVEVIPEFFV